MTRERFQWVLLRVVAAIAIVAILALLVLLWAADVASRADDIAQAPARIGGFLGWLQTNPAAQLWTMIVTLALILFLALYDGPLWPLSLFGFGGRNTRVEPPEIAPAPDQRPSRLRADWPIRDLFFHVRPDVLQDEGGTQVWKEVGREIRQAHAEGDLIIWATSMPKDHLEEMDFPQNRKPPVKLRTDYWQDGDFTYNFFDQREEARFQAHVQTDALNPKDESYCDLMVNKAQALALWPEEKGKDEATGGIAVWRMSETLASEFGWTVKQAADAIESAASLGAIRVIGRKMGPGTPPLRVLPPEYWTDHTLNLHAPKGDSLGQTFAKSNRLHNSDTYDLRVFESEVWKAIKRDSGLERDRGG